MYMVEKRETEFRKYWYSVLVSLKVEEISVSDVIMKSVSSSYLTEAIVNACLELCIHIDVCIT